jgi:hypothetical protein
LGKLVERYVKLKSGNEDYSVHVKTMREEYEEIKEIMRKETEIAEVCDEKIQTKTNVTVKEEDFNNFPLSCSLEDSFEIHTSLLNNINFYP